MTKNNNYTMLTSKEMAHNMSDCLRGLSGLEYKILVFLAHKAISEGIENHECVYDIRDFWEQRERSLNGKNYCEFRECVENISRLRYTVKVDGFNTSGYWFSRIGFYEGGTEGVVKFDDYSYDFMREYIKDKDNCSSIMNMTSKYGIRLYNCLKDHVGERDFVVPLEKLKVDMGVDKNKCSEYRYFKRDVMAPAIFEVNNHTDFLVSFKEKRTNRYVSHLIFTILRKQPVME